MSVSQIIRPMHCVLLIALSLAVLLPFSFAYAEITVAIGPTAIPRGNATGARDITVSNELFSIAFAVDTAPPWGVARGGIVDIALIREGKPGYDIASLVDFMPNNWSSQPTSYQQVVIEKKTADEVIIKSTRDWGEVDLETIFSIRDDSKIHIVTRMTNNSDVLLKDLLSGYVVWPDGGYLFGVPGLPDSFSSAEDDALADWSASYDEHWLLGLHAPFAEYVAYNGRDRYLQHDLQPGESRSFEAWLQIENDGTLAPLVQAEIEFQQLESGQITGRVMSDDGKPVPRPAVIVLKNGKPYAWTLGSNGDYEINLPSGSYDIYATASGATQGTAQTVTVAKGTQNRIDFNDIKSSGRLKIKALNQTTKKPLDARISVQNGYKPLIKYFGKNTFFTELDTKGETTVSIAPGHYVLEISAGGGFTSAQQLVEVDVISHALKELRVEIPVTVMPREMNWYSADLHHHSDVLDGFTEASFVLRSELAAGLDIAFLSDHDSIINNQEMQILSTKRGMHFIPAMELSPSWGHFNAYPLDAGKNVDIDIGQATVQEVFAAARRMGADIIEVNHPYSDYGYFNSITQPAMHSEEKSGVVTGIATGIATGIVTGIVTGTYDAGFDLVEITPQDNSSTLKHIWQMWNKGDRVYLAAGSDVHDVWRERSGSARTYAFVDGVLSVDKFIAALKAGHAFASQGPVIYPEILFGSEVHHPAGTELVLAYSIEAISGLRSVQLIERGTEIEVFTAASNEKPTQVDFIVNPEADTWYSLVVEDMQGKFAYTNPVWVLVTE